MRVVIATWNSTSSDIPTIGSFVKSGSRIKTITRLKELAPFIYLAWSDTEPFLITCYHTMELNQNIKAFIGSCYEIPVSHKTMELYCLQVSGEWCRITTCEVKGIISIGDNLYKVNTADGYKYFVVIN